MVKINFPFAPAVEDHALILLPPRQRTVTYGTRPLAAIVAFVPVVANASLIAIMENPMERRDAEIHGRQTIRLDGDLVKQKDGTRTFGKIQATLDVVHCTRVKTRTREVVLVVVVRTIDHFLNSISFVLRVRRDSFR